jgi:molybdopterin synthase catalytic subunit
MVRLTHTPIDPEALRRELVQGNDSCGGIVVFEGRVRNFSQGKQVTALAYECYEPMALKVMEEIRQEALKKFKVERIISVHRHGPIPISEIAVWIGVAAPHRADAFEACQFMIDGIKAKVPIWKKEEFADGTHDWVHQNC